MIETIMSLDYV